MKQEPVTLFNKNKSFYLFYYNIFQKTALTIRKSPAVCVDCGRHTNHSTNLTKYKLEPLPTI